MATKLLEGPSMLEQLVPIQKELAVIVARNERGQIACYPVVEMEFDPEANLVNYLFAPAQISPEIAAKAVEIATRTAIAYNICGLLAVELFLTPAGEILVNEVAPRPHNSGHHTIESCPVSQFEQHIRGVLNLPLGDTRLLASAAMVNILGEAGYTGAVRYEGLDEILAAPQVFVHLYGKAETRPSRKMGHVTIMGSSLEEVREKANWVNETLKCKGAKKI
ncbi:MAG: ATP-grasp domain-containing protein [Saprospiraceae bacterium]